MFVWRACNGILPLGVELFRRHVSSSPFCGSCDAKVESLSHVLFECRGCKNCGARNLLIFLGSTIMPRCRLFYKCLGASIDSGAISRGGEICLESVGGAQHRGPWMYEWLSPDVVTWAKIFLDTYRDAAHQNLVDRPPALP